MADFLDLNGVSISVADSSAQVEAPEDIGETDRAVDATLLRTRINLKQNYSFTTAPIDPATAYALMAFINGLGNHWSFDASIYSGKGLGFAGGSASYQQNNSGGKYVGDLQVGTGLGGAVVNITPSGLDAPSASNLTVMFWARQQDGVTWKHYLYTSAAGGGWFINGVSATDGVTATVNIASLPTIALFPYASGQNGGVAPATWLATHAYALNAYVQPTTYNGRFYKATTGGTSGSTQPTWPTVLGNTVNDGSVVWTDQGPSPLFIDDLVILPFGVPTAWIAGLYAFAQTQAYPDNPMLWMSGLFPLYAANVMGNVAGSKLMQVTLGGILTQNYQAVSFTLREA